MDGAVLPPLLRPALPQPVGSARAPEGTHEGASHGRSDGSSHGASHGASHGPTDGATRFGASAPHPALQAAALAAVAALAALAPRGSVLPWAASAEDERRFRRILRCIGGVVLLLAVVLPFVPLRAPERSAAAPAALPPPMARLLLERPPAPPPPPVKPPPAAELARTPADQPPSAAKAPPPSVAPKKAAPVPEARQPIDGRPPGEVALDNARRKASGVGLLAMKNELAELSGAPAAVQLRNDIQPGPGVGTGSGPGVGAGTDAGLPARALITAAAGKGSGGIATGAVSRDNGGGGLAGRATTLVAGVAGGGGARDGNGSGSAVGGVGGAGGGGGKGGALTRGGSGKASRSIEDIKLVFERQKGAIHAIYNRALRDEPALQGKVVLELKIAPGGAVETVRLVSSELKNEALEARLLARIRQFDFGAKDVDVMLVTWPVDFLPS